MQGAITLHHLASIRGIDELDASSGGPVPAAAGSWSAALAPCAEAEVLHSFARMRRRMRGPCAGAGWMPSNSPAQASKN